MYAIEDSLTLLSRDPPPKSEFKSYFKTMITAFHEKELRNKALVNSCMKYFNTSVLGLGGKCHPAISNIHSTTEVINMRPHTKMEIILHML